MYGRLSNFSRTNSMHINSLAISTKGISDEMSQDKGVDYSDQDIIEFEAIFGEGLLCPVSAYWTD